MTSKEALAKIRTLVFGQQSFASMKTKEGMEITVEGDVELGKDIYMITEDGQIPAMDGEFEMEDGMVLIVKEAKIDKLKYPSAEVEEELEVEVEVKEEELEEDKVEEEMMEEEKEEKSFVSAELIDGTIVENDSEELKVGDELFVVTEEGRIAAADAEHETTDGKIVVTVDGVITEIKEKEEIEVEVEEEVELSEMMEVFTAGFNRLSEELNIIREKYDNLQENFEKFSAAPAGEKMFDRKGYIADKKQEKFSKLEALAALRNKK